MPISNQSSENRMTKTTMRLDSRGEFQRSQQIRNLDNQLESTNSYPYKTRPIVNTDTSKSYTIAENSSLDHDPLPSNITRSSPRFIRVKRIPPVPQSLTRPVSTTVKSSEQETTTKRVLLKDTTSRGTTPPPASFFDKFPKNQTVHYSTSYEPSSSFLHPTATPASTSEVVVGQQLSTNNSKATTTTKTSTRTLDRKTLEVLNDDDNDSFIEETKTTTTIIKPIEVPTIPQVTTTSTVVAPAVPAVGTTIIDERPRYRTRRYRRRRRTSSISTFSNYTTTSTDSYTTSSSNTTRPSVIKHHTILPPRPPIQTTIIQDPPTTIVPERRFIHHVRRTRTHSGYYSSDLDFGKRKVYKSDYKYRHYYYCNWCKGRCDLSNSSCGCCEWFYGCPLWGLFLAGLLLLALIVTFFTLFGLQPSINSARRSDTAQTQLLNRTQIIYGFLKNCGYQSNSPTTLVLCSNTITTSTSIVQLSSYYIISKGIQISFSSKIFILVFVLNLLK